MVVQSGDTVIQPGTKITQQMEDGTNAGRSTDGSNGIDDLSLSTDELSTTLKPKGILNNRLRNMLKKDARRRKEYAATFDSDSDDTVDTMSVDELRNQQH
uniref:Uncharacterized protein n=1 Tax=Lygus hesperus TaxID=30085 RepID=A0A0A9Z7M9_LYGHE